MLKSDGFHGRSEKIGPAIFISGGDIAEPRTCKKCGETKQYENFKKSGRHGYRCFTCKKCDATRLALRLREHRDEINAARRQRRARNPEPVRAQARAQLDRRRDRVRVQNAAAVQRYKERHPEKVAARRAVQAAVKRGHLVKPQACQAEGCERGAGLIAHHGSYAISRRLDVTWLCRDHHERLHHYGPIALKAGGPRKFARAPKTLEPSASLAEQPELPQQFAFAVGS